MCTKMFGLQLQGKELSSQQEIDNRYYCNKNSSECSKGALRYLLVLHSTRREERFKEL